MPYKKFADVNAGYPKTAQVSGQVNKAGRDLVIALIVLFSAKVISSNLECDGVGLASKDFSRPSI